MDRVQLVEITAYADDDAYTIFETMNDRGLSAYARGHAQGLPAGQHRRRQAAPRPTTVWRERLRNLDEQAEDAESDCLKTWLRSQYATKIRERNKGLEPEDFDRIGTEFHRWLRGTDERIGLITADDFYAFIDRDFDFYSRSTSVLAHHPADPS